MPPELKYEWAYRQLRDRIVRAQQSGVGALPRESELAAELGIGRITLRTALKRLEEERLVRRIRGKGTFLRQDASGWQERARGRRLLLVRRDESQDTSGFFIQEGATARCRELGVELECLDRRLMGENAPGNGIAEQLSKRGYAGVVLAMGGFLGNDALTPLLTGLSIPVVMPFAHEYDRVVLPFTVFDIPIRLAVMTGVHYLKRTGHTRIAFLGPHGADFINGVTPHEYRQMTAPEPPLFLKAARTAGEIAAAVDELLSSPLRPTALQCIDSYYAALVLEALTARGIRVPEEMSLLGYGDMPGCELLNPPLSHVSPRLLERGAAAVDFLLGGLAAPPTLGVRLVELGSVAPPCDAKRRRGSRKEEP